MAIFGSTLMECGTYIVLVFFIIPGIRTKSTPLGMVYRPTMGDPVTIRMLTPGRTRLRAMAMVRRMCPRPYVSWEYINILYDFDSISS